MAQDQMKLGPCPLCGGEPKPSGFDYDREQKYFSCICGLDVPMSVWNRLSAIAEQNRRRGEEIEKRKLEWNALLKLIEWHGGGQIIDDIDDDNQNWKKCMEWAEDERRTKNNAR